MNSFTIVQDWGKWVQLWATFLGVMVFLCPRTRFEHVGRATARRLKQAPLAMYPTKCMIKPTGAQLLKSKPPETYLATRFSHNLCRSTPLP